MHKVKNSQSYFKNDDIQRETSDLSRPFWRPVYRFVCHNSGALQTLLFKFSFFSRTSIKIHRIASNNFTMHLIISKLLRRQKCRQRRKTIRLKDVEAERKNCLGKGFHSFKYVIHHANIRFFSLISLQTCSHSLNHVNGLHCFMWFLFYYFLHLFSSDCFAALTRLYPYNFFIWIY